MANKSADYRSGLAKAKGLGSSKTGLHHWKVQRISAFAMIPLTIWFMVSLVSGIGYGQVAAASFFSSSFNATMMVLFIVCSFYHASLGLQVVIEDYVHKPLFKYGGLITVKLGSLALAAFGVISVLKLLFAA